MLTIFIIVAVIAIATGLISITATSLYILIKAGSIVCLLVAGYKFATWLTENRK